MTGKSEDGFQAWLGPGPHTRSPGLVFSCGPQRTSWVPSTEGEGHGCAQACPAPEPPGGAGPWVQEARPSASLSRLLCWDAASTSVQRAYRRRVPLRVSFSPSVPVSLPRSPCLPLPLSRSLRSAVPAAPVWAPQGQREPPPGGGADPSRSFSVHRTRSWFSITIYRVRGRGQPLCLSPFICKPRIIVVLTPGGSCELDDRTCVERGQEVTE